MSAPLAASAYEPTPEFVSRFGPPAAPPPTQHTPTEHRDLGRSSFGVFVLTTLIQLMGAIATFALGKTFASGTTGLAVMGEVAFFLLIASSINWLGDLRIGAAYTYYVSRGQPARELTGTYLGLRLILVTACSLATLPVTFLLAGSLHFGFSFAQYESFGLFLLMPILWTPWMVIQQLRIARGASIRSQYPQFVEVIVRSLAIILTIYLDPGLLGFTYAYILGGIASLAYCLPELWRELSPPARERAVQMLRYSWPLMGSLMFQFLASNAPPFFVTGLIRSSVAFNTFSYDNGWRILLLSVPSAVVLPLFPYLASFHAKGEFPVVQRKTWEALRFTAMIVVPAAVALVAYRSPIPNLLYNGHVAQQGSTTLALLGLAAVPLGLSQVIGTSLNSIGYQRLELYISATIVGAMVASTVGIYLLIPTLWAIAAGVLVSSIAALALNTYFMEHLLHVRIRPLPIVRITVAAAAAFGIMAVVNDFIDPSRSYILLSALLLGFVVYAFVLAAIGELTKQDVMMVNGALGLPERLGRTVARLCWSDAPPP